MPAKGQKMGEEFREKKRQELLKRWQKPGYREMISGKMQGHTVSEQARQKIGAGRLGKPLTEEHKAKMSAGSKRRWQDPEYAERLRAFMKSDEFKSQLNSPEARAIISAKKTAFWAAMSPEERAERCKKWLAAGSEAQRGVPKSPEAKAKLSIMMTAYLRTPEGMAHLAAIRQGDYHKFRDTKLEQNVRSVLDSLEVSYEQSKPIGPYEADFYIADLNLVLECDGVYWHSTPAQTARDRRRDGWFKHHGYRVARLPEAAIDADAMDCVCKALRRRRPP